MIRTIFGYLVHPGALLRSGPKPAGARLIAVTDPEDPRVTPAQRSALDAGEQALIARGFTVSMRVFSRYGSSIQSVVSLVEHPVDGGVGFILASAPSNLPFLVVTTFATDFADGMQVMTSNSDSIARTPTRPKVDSARFPDIHDPGALYDLHARRVKLKSATVRVVPTTRAPDPIAYQDREAREIQAFWIQCGEYRPVEGDQLELTPLGARRAAWRGLFPWKQLTLARERRKREEILRQITR